MLCELQGMFDRIEQHLCRRHSSRPTIPLEKVKSPTLKNRGSGTQDLFKTLPTGHPPRGCTFGASSSHGCPGRLGVSRN